MKRLNCGFGRLLLAVAPFTLGTLGVLVMAPRLAHADDVDAMGGSMVELDARLRDLEMRVKDPPRPGPELAERRLIDAQVLYELKNYEAASIILFDIVDKYKGTVAYSEALYYLADSLYEQRDYFSAHRYYDEVVQIGPKHRRYQEALQRLVELSLHTGVYDHVDEYIAKLEAVSDHPLQSVPYVKGKYFFFRQQYQKAIDALNTVTKDNEYYFQSRYFIGAAYTTMGPEKLGDAVTTFADILKLDPKTDAQRRVNELTHMALGRIYLDRDQLTNAIAEYSRISSKSDLFNDQLFESAYVYIKGRDFIKARRSLDLLLTNAPESMLAPDAKLLIGKLYIRQQEYVPATDSFTKTRDEYKPIFKALDDEMKRTSNPAYFNDLITKNLTKFDVATALSPLASKWMKTDADVIRVTTLVQDVGSLQRSLNESDEIIKRLEKALTGASRVNVFPELAQSRSIALKITAEVVDVKKRLVHRQEQLISPVAGNESAALHQLNNERDELEAKLRAMPVMHESLEDRETRIKAFLNDLDAQASQMRTELQGVETENIAVNKYYHDEVEAKLSPERRIEAQHELDSWSKQLAGWRVELDVVRRDTLDASQSVGIDDAELEAAQKVRSEYDDCIKRIEIMSAQVRSRLRPAERTKAEQIASILDRSTQIDQRLAAINARIDGILDVRLKDITEEVHTEKTTISAFRDTLKNYSGESGDVGGGVLAESFKAVTGRFYNIVVRSDVGIIDVAWALKDSSTQEDGKLRNERKRELKLLDDEFKEVLKE